MAKQTRYAYEGHRRIVLKPNETQRNDGLYLYYYYDKDHKRKSISSRTIDGLRRKEAELNKESADNIRSDKRNITVNNTHEEWLTSKNVNKHTLANYDWLYNTFVRHDFGKKKLRNVTEADVTRLYTSLLHDKNLAVTTVDGLQTVMQQVFAYGQRQRYISHNPCSGVMKDLKKTFGKPKKVEAFSLSQQNRFLSYLLEYDEKNKSNWYPLFATMILTGLRVGEMAGLQWSDVHLDETPPRLFVMHNLVYYKDNETDEMVWQMNDPKTKAGIRDFILTQKAAEALRMQRSAHLTCEKSIDGYDDFVFVNRFGQTQHQGTVNRAMKRIITAANLDALERNKRGDSIPILPAISSHGLRKSFITRCAESGVSLKVCAKMVGHNDYRTTMEIYTMVNDEWEKNELEKLEEHLED